MGAARDAIIACLDETLEVERFSDYGPIGLQVDGSAAEVERMAVAVSSTLETFEAAAAWGAQLLVVHHGLFWDGDSRAIGPVLRRRLEVLFAAGMSLAAYHLPLDAHPALGNNAGLARALGVEVEGSFMHARGGDLALHGRLREPCAAGELAARVETALGRPPLVFEGSTGRIERIGLCSGAAGRSIGEAAGLGLDAFLSGEPEEDSRALARELGVTYIAAGHHATERFGVRALAELVEGRFGVETRFLDVPNPV